MKDFQIYLGLIKGTLTFADLDEKFRSDYNLILTVVKYNGLLLEFVIDDLKKDRLIALSAVENNPEAFKFIDPILKRDRCFLLGLIRKDVDVYNMFDKDIQNDMDFILDAIAVDVNVFSKLSTETWNNPKILIAMFSSKDCYWGDVPDQSVLENNFEYALATVSNSGFDPDILTVNYLDDYELSYLGVLQNPSTLFCIKDEYKNDINLVKDALERSMDYAYDILRNNFIGDNLFQNYEFNSWLIDKNPKYVEFCNGKFRDLTLKALSKDGSAIKVLSDSDKEDYEFIYVSLKENHKNIVHISSEIRQKLETVSEEKARENWLLLQFSGPKFEIKTYAPFDIKFYYIRPLYY